MQWYWGNDASWVSNMETLLHRNVLWTSDSNLKRELGNWRDVIKAGSNAETRAKNTSRNSSDWFFPSAMSRKQHTKLLAEHRVSWHTAECFTIMVYFCLRKFSSESKPKHQHITIKNSCYPPTAFRLWILTKMKCLSVQIERQFWP